MAMYRLDVVQIIDVDNRKKSCAGLKSDLKCQKIGENRWILLGKLGKILLNGDVPKTGTVIENTGVDLPSHSKYSSMRRFLKTYWPLLKKTFQEFMNDNALKLSASLSYYTLFSLAPMLLVFMSVVGIFYGREGAYISK